MELQNPTPELVLAYNEQFDNEGNIIVERALLKHFQTFLHNAGVA